jgi:hypothetical protein
VVLGKGSVIEANTVVTSVGNAANPVIVDLCKQLGIEAPKGRVPTDAMMRVAGLDTLWAAGDGAAVPWVDKGVTKVSPMTAQFAFRQGTLLGKNVFAALRGAELLPFRYRYMGQLATIGERAAVAEIFGMHFKGFIAWWMWRTIYLAKLPGVVRKLRVMIDWTFDLIFPRDISQIMPPPDDAVRAIHLEKGETLFIQGTPARGFFYIKDGIAHPDGQGTAGPGDRPGQRDRPGRARLIKPLGGDRHGQRAVRPGCFPRAHPGVPEEGPDPLEEACARWGGHSSECWRSSPGWHLSSRQSASSVLKRMARALLVFSIERLARVRSTRAASSVSVIFRSSMMRSRFTWIGMVRVA